MYNRSKVHFSPWVEVIKKISNIPPEFQGYYKESENFELLFAVPFDIKTFSHVVGVYYDYLYILNYTKKKVISHKIFYKDILYLKCTEILLLGKFEIITVNEDIQFEFSVVSMDIIKKVISKIRDNYILTDTNYDVSKNENYNLNTLRHFFRHIFSLTKKENSDVRIIGNQSDYEIPRNNNRFLTKLLHSFTSPVLLSSLYLQTNREIIIHNSGKNFKIKNDASYGHSVIYIPIEKLKEILEEKNSKYNTLSSITLKIVNKEFGFILEEKNPEKDRLINEVNNLIQFKYS